MLRKSGPAARWTVIPGAPSTRFNLFTSAAMSSTSISLLRRASTWAVGSMTRKTIRSSFGRLPHHFGLRTRLMVFAVSSRLSNLNGPAVVSGFALHPSLNTAGSLFVDAGYSGENSAFQSV
jgi:hypothetical protein